MKAFTVVLLAVLVMGCKEETKQVELKSEQDKLSYAYGMEKARTILDDSKLVGLNKDIIQAAVNESLAGKAQIGGEEAIKYMIVVNKKMIEASEKAYKEQMGDIDPFDDEAIKGDKKD